MIDLAYLTSLNIIEYHLYFAVFILGRKLQLSISFWSIVSLSFFRFS
jgi:hypothetical protein